jgi:hypothetical protein
VIESHPHAIERGPGGWLRQRRTRIALWIAAAEGILVAISHELTKWTVLGLAVISVALFYVARNHRSHILRQTLWILAASQLLALILVALAVIVKWALILGLVVFAVVGLAFLFFDRR